MSAQSQLEELFSSLNVGEEKQKIIDELKNSFDENHVEAFFEKLETIEDIDDLLESSEQSPERSDQFIDFISQLIINK